MSLENDMLKLYMRKAASKGGKAGTEAQRKARKRNAAKARANRWKKE